MERLAFPAMAARPFTPASPTRKVWRWLRDRRFSAYKFRRQHPLGAHTLDFFCNEAKLNIELDGSQHGHPEPVRADAARDRWLAARGIKVLRYWNGRLRREPQVVRDTIWQTLQERAPKPWPAYCQPGVVPAKAPETLTPHD